MFPNCVCQRFVYFRSLIKKPAFERIYHSLALCFAIYLFQLLSLFTSSFLFNFSVGSFVNIILDNPSLNRTQKLEHMGEVLSLNVYQSETATFQDQLIQWKGPHAENSCQIREELQSP